jgi:hypothetical protein
MVSSGSRQRSSTPYSSSLPAAGGSGSAARCRPSRVSASLPGADLQASAVCWNACLQTATASKLRTQEDGPLGRPQQPQHLNDQQRFGTRVCFAVD